MPSLSQKDQQLVQKFLASHPITKLPDYVPIAPPTDVSPLRSLAIPSRFYVTPTPVYRNISPKD